MFEFAPPSIEWIAILPLIIVSLTGLVALIVEIVQPRRNNNLIVGVSLGGLILAALSLLIQTGESAFDTAAGMIQRDSLSTVLQLVIVISTSLAILFSEPYLREKRIAFGEFYPLVLWSSVGAMMLCATTNLLMIFLGVEILSISLYVLAGLSRREERSEESALKYFLLGAFASGFLLYGIAFLYGATGSLQLDSIGVAWMHRAGDTRTLIVFGLGLMLVGLCFKTSLVPFHQWTPDVYQGAPTNVSAFMASSSKVGAFAALWRVLDASTQVSTFWVPVLGTIAVLTILLGNVFALAQTDVKRILGYSSVAHAGYILVAIIAHARAPGVIGVNTLCYYLFSYTLMTIGAFAVVSLGGRQGQDATRLEDLNGLWKRNPLAAACLWVCLASLIGIPPFSGFFGKAFIFADALKADLTPLALVLAVGSVIGVYYYLRIALAALATDQTETEVPRRTASASQATYVICAAAVLLAAVFYAPLMSSLGLGGPHTAAVAMRASK